MMDSPYKIKLSNTFFRSLYENSPLGIIVCTSLECAPTMANESVCKMLGYSEEELMNLRLDSITHPDDLPQELTLIQKLLKGELAKVKFEKRYISKSGEVLWAKLHISAIQDDDEAADLIVYMIQDITERKKAEVSLQESERRFRRLFKSSPICIHEIDLEGHIISMSPAGLKMLGLTDEKEIAGKFHIDSIAEMDKTRIEELFRKACQGEPSEFQFLTRSGKIFKSGFTPLTDENCKVISIMGQAQDVTEQTESFTKLKENIERFNTIANSIPGIVMVYKLKPDGTDEFLYVSAGAKEIWGITQEEAVEDTDRMWKYIDEKHILGMKLSIRESATHLTEWDHEWISSLPSGLYYKWLQGKGSPSKLSDGSVVWNIIILDITERKQSEEKVRGLSTIVESSMNEIYVFDTNQLIFQFVNKAAINNLGYSNEEIYAMTPVDIKPEFSHERFLQHIRPLLTGEIELLKFETVHQRKNGTTYEVEVNLQLSDFEGKKVFAAIIIDITDRVVSEKARLESEQTLSKAQKIAKIGSWKVDVRNNILEWSEEAHKIFNVPMGKSPTYEDFLSYVHPEDKEYVDASWKAALGGASYDIVHRIIVGNKIKWVRGQAELLFDELRNLIYGFGTVQDITDQKILQEANLIFNQSQLLTGLGSWRWSFKTGELFWSDNIFNLFGLNKETTEVTYENYLNAIYPEDRERVKAIGEKSRANKEPFEVEYRVERRPGEIRWLHGSGNVLADQKGHTIEMYGMVRDITTEKINTDELIKARKEAEEANAIKDNFLSVMSHEIRTPLNSVIGLGNLLLRRSPREDQLEIMKTLKGSADNLLHLVNDILDFNKIRAGKVELEFLPFSLSTFLQHLHASFKLSALDKGLVFNIQSDTRIPDTLVGDITRLNQIFNNLLSNAIKFTHKGHVKLLVELENLSEKACSLIFKIEDTGIGIATIKLNSVFQPFHQTESDISRKFGGTGLGLSIVKALVGMLKGSIRVSSTEGKGTVFMVQIELATSSPVEELALPFTTPIFTPKVLPANKKEANILYVEDVESNRFLIETLLSDNNIKCISVSSGKAALKFTKSKKFNLILMDIQMPGMDGYMATKKILNQAGGKNKKTPVIAFTAEPYSESLRKKVIEQGIREVITKPFNMDNLLEKIQVYIKPKERKDNSFSFSFYEKAFDQDKQKLKKIKKAVIADMRRFEKNFLLKNKDGDLAGMRAEIHRIRPILKNLKCDALIHTLDNFRLYEEYSTGIKKMANETRKMLPIILNWLTKLKY